MIINPLIINSFELSFTIIKNTTKHKKLSIRLFLQSVKAEISWLYNLLKEVMDFFQIKCIV